MLVPKLVCQWYYSCMTSPVCVLCMCVCACVCVVLRTKGHFAALCPYRRGFVAWKANKLRFEGWARKTQSERSNRRTAPHYFVCLKFLNIILIKSFFFFFNWKPSLHSLKVAAGDFCTDISSGGQKLWKTYEPSSPDTCHSPNLSFSPRPPSVSPSHPHPSFLTTHLSLPFPLPSGQTAAIRFLSAWFLFN